MCGFWRCQSRAEAPLMRLNLDPQTLRQEWCRNELAVTLHKSETAWLHLERRNRCDMKSSFLVLLLVWVAVSTTGRVYAQSISGVPPVTPPPDSFFEMVSSRDRDPAKA